MERELPADEKELAEHNMLVGLGRNDLGRISEFSTVEVTAYQVIHKYSKIMHICSQVESDISSGCDACDAIEAVLPTGTLSGATTGKIFETVRRARQKTDIPLAFMTYITPVFVYGAELFIQKAVDCGVDALIAPISKERIQSIAKEAEGFVY